MLHGLMWHSLYDEPHGLWPTLNIVWVMGNGAIMASSVVGRYIFILPAMCRNVTNRMVAKAAFCGFSSIWWWQIELLLLA